MMVLLITLVFRPWRFGTSAWIGVPVHDPNVSVASDAGSAPHGNCILSTTYLSTLNSVWNIMSLLLLCYLSLPLRGKGSIDDLLAGLTKNEVEVSDGFGAFMIRLVQWAISSSILLPSTALVSMIRSTCSSRMPVRQTMKSAGCMSVRTISMSTV